MKGKGMRRNQIYNGQQYHERKGEEMERTEGKGQERRKEVSSRPAQRFHTHSSRKSG